MAYKYLASVFLLSSSLLIGMASVGSRIDRTHAVLSVTREERTIVFKNYSDATLFVRIRCTDPGFLGSSMTVKQMFDVLPKSAIQFSVIDSGGKSHVELIHDDKVAVDVDTQTDKKILKIERFDGREIVLKDAEGHSRTWPLPGEGITLQIHADEENL